jgi:hypothetical protein
MRKESLVAQPPHQPQPPHPKPAAKPLHPNDLPDLLADSRDVPMASADDLLSEIVGDDVERLMSGEYEPIVPGHKAVERLQHQIGKFLDEVRQRDHATPTTMHLPAPARAPRTPAPSALKPFVHEEDAAPSLDDLVGPTQEELVGLHSGEFESTDARGPAESRALLAPVDEAAGEPVYFRPLDWLSRPVAALSGRGRVAVSLLALMSFLGGCAALGYVLMPRHGGV